MVKFFNLAELARGGSVTSGATQSSLYCKGHNFSTNLRLKKTHIISPSSTIFAVRKFKLLTFTLYTP